MLINKQDSGETEDWEEALKVRGRMNTGIHFKKDFCVHYLLSSNRSLLNLMTQNNSRLLGLRSSWVILVVLLSWVSLC